MIIVPAESDPIMNIYQQKTYPQEGLPRRRPLLLFLQDTGAPRVRPGVAKDRPVASSLLRALALWLLFWPSSVPRSRLRLSFSLSLLSLFLFISPLSLSLSLLLVSCLFSSLFHFFLLLLPTSIRSFLPPSIFLLPFILFLPPSPTPFTFFHPSSLLLPFCFDLCFFHTVRYFLLRQCFPTPTAFFIFSSFGIKRWCASRFKKREKW